LFFLFFRLVFSIFYLLTITYTTADYGGFDLLLNFSVLAFFFWFVDFDLLCFQKSTSVHQPKDPIKKPKKHTRKRANFS
jgi:hypothetical protein